MKALLTVLLTMVLLALCPQKSIAQIEQDTSTLWRIETIDGNEFFGKVIQRTATGIDLQTQTLGLIQIPFAQIRSMSPVNPKLVKGNEVWLENPQATRYFWAPNGYGLKKGEGYYQNVWIFFNQVSFGITNNTSIGFGIVPAFLFAGAPTPVWITPKVSIPVAKEKFNLGAGALLGYVIGEEEAFFGILYGTGTIGSRDHNLTFGLGYGVASGGWAKSPTLSLAGMTRISKRSYLVSENYLISTDESTLVLLSFGGRTVWSRISLDYGLFIPASNDIDVFFAIPWLGLVVPFGKKK